ncbi:hypothetical protein Bca52824_092839 [Brassica carinata]|uniref:Uncharacterized protein n=1 Tax=Brassica carinata TaxID=52824 RepID=A0A8X7P670_BRACI|nr:hypothetical protein Bca52824_092839 [Brassica carinata]
MYLFWSLDTVVGCGFVGGDRILGPGFRSIFNFWISPLVSSSCLGDNGPFLRWLVAGSRGGVLGRVESIFNFDLPLVSLSRSGIMDHFSMVGSGVTWLRRAAVGSGGWFLGPLRHRGGALLLCLS